jgi:hypothetical protein
MLTAKADVLLTVMVLLPFVAPASMGSQFSAGGHGVFPRMENEPLFVLVAFRMVRPWSAPLTV